VRAGLKKELVDVGRDVSRSSWRACVPGAAAVAGTTRLASGARGTEAWAREGKRAFILIS
jgi:hypothetical protein